MVSEEAQRDSPQQTTNNKHKQKKKPSAVAGKASSCFAPRVGAKGVETLKVTGSIPCATSMRRPGKNIAATVPARVGRSYFFFFVVFLVEDFLAGAFFFVAMALVPPFSAAQSKER